MMRRSSRTSGAMRADAASALADLASRKASGTTRTADYEVNEEADIYETVDDQTYAAIAAQMRKEARDFIAAPDNGNPDDEGAAMELEFEMEDELSVFGNQSDRKRKRTSAPRITKRSMTPTKRVSSSFFNSFYSAPKPTVVEAEEDNKKGVFDGGLLDADFDKHVAAQRHARRKRKLAIERSVGDILFDVASDVPQSAEPALAAAAPLNSSPPREEPVDEYAAPPPSLKISDASGKPHIQTTKPLSTDLLPNPVLDDSLDADALMAAADSAAAQRESRSVPSRALYMTTAAQPKAGYDVNPVPHIPTDASLARDNTGNLIMFWTDAHDVRVNGGQHLYLFGKAPIQHVNSGLYASVCVLVQGMDRVLHVLPRKHRLDSNGNSTMESVKLVPDVHSEISSVLLGKATGKQQDLRGSSNLPTTVKAKKVVRCCPFGDEFAPREATEYLKVKFPFSNFNKLQPDSSGTTYSRVYGTRASASEMFCLKRKLKGPSWITVSNTSALDRNVTHAKYAFSVPSPADIGIPTELANKDPPPLSALCINTKTILNPKNGAHELVMISGLFVRDVPLSGPLREGALESGGPSGTRDFTLVRPPDGISVPFGFADRARSLLTCGGVEVTPNEPALMNNFLTKLLRYDPDVIIGHDILGFGLDVLIARMSVRRSREWSRLGRLVQRRDLTQVVKNNISSQWFKSEAVAGRLVLDTYLHAKELLIREKDYSLTSLSQTVLVPSCGDYVAIRPSTDVSAIPKAFESTDALCRLVSECESEARTAGRIAAHLNILPLSRQLTCISGNIWSHTLRGARAERIEYLLSHEFKLIGSSKSGASAKAGDVEAKLLLPDKLTKVERAKISESLQRENSTRHPNASELKYGGGSNRKQVDVEPRAKSGKGKSSRRKPQYSGGLVLEPKRGFYDRYVLQLDFNSLYPSIIQEFNICFTTLKLDKREVTENMRKGNANEDEVESSERDISLSHDYMKLVPPGASLMEGVLPRVLRRLVLQRRQVKKLLKEERQRAGKETLRAQQLDVRQLAIKLTANSLYGCLGFEGSRFFARPLAEMVTSQGRNTLQDTVDLAQNAFNAQVIYGDTDSLFVYTGLENIGMVRKVGAELKRDVNKKYRMLEIEIDAIYRKMLLLKKKKYAALKVVDPMNPEKVVREVKGLDLVRHDWCDLSHDASEHFLSQIFQGQSSNVDDAVGNILSFLSGLAARVNNNQIDLSKYIITRSLTKRPQDYPDGTSLPHVAVASRLINEQGRRLKPGDYIKYVICMPAGTKARTSSGNIANRAYHPDEVRDSKGALVIDVKYYLENQVLPPVLRLCEPIESIEASRVALSLGLDGRRYERKDDLAEKGNYLALGPESSAEKYRDVDPLTIKCPGCGVNNELTGVIFSSSGKAIKSSGLECCKCLKMFGKAALCNTITLTLRSWIAKYYNTSLVQDCGDGHRRREVRDIGLGGNDSCAQRKFDEAWLYKQLRYAQHISDVRKRWDEVSKIDERERKLPMSTTDIAHYDMLMGKIDRILDANAYRFIDASEFLVPLGVL